MSAKDPQSNWKSPGSSGRAPRISFQDTITASSVLQRILPLLSETLAAALPELLAESPDPDSALIFLDRLITHSPESLHLFEQHHFLVHYAVLVGGHSRFLSETLIQSADLLPAFLREKNLDRSFSHEDFEEALARFRSRSFEADISLLLARFKKREYIRIMLRDVLKLAPLAETTAEISVLADVLIDNALREGHSRLQRRFGLPQYRDAAGRLVDTPFTILSLGKLGGNELNYSSDVDVLYIFGGGEESPLAALTNREYFIRLAQEVTGILSRVTREGAVFRIDLRLRPLGNEGELALSLPQALQYYAVTAHDWEKQALLKVRCSAGDRRLARDFIHGVQQHVYTEEVNFAAIKTALSAREKIHQHRLHQPKMGPSQGVDVKIDAGGIRDIEFLVQCLQRVYGGKEPWLRSRGTLFALQKLHDKGHISGKEFHELSSAYEFLRHLEHRMQLRQGQQTHRLPVDGPELQILQRAMEGYAPGEDRFVDLPSTVRQRMGAVTEIYQRIVYHQNTRRDLEHSEGAFELRNVTEPGIAEQSNQQILERLSVDAPDLHDLATQSELTPQARKNLFRFLSAAFTSSERYAAVVRHPEAVAYALPVFEVSDYLTDILIRHPGEITTLSELQTMVGTETDARLFEGGPEDDQVTDPVFDYLGASSAPQAEKLLLLRQHYRHRMFEAGAKDLAELRDVYESLRETTFAADGAIGAALGIAGSPDGLAVLAVGRLGSLEFDVLSDADLIFICDENADRFLLTKAAEQLMQALAAYTRDGMVFPVDTRLRPHGSQGELLICPSQLQTYFEQEAQPWEALMYSKARWVAGSRELAERAISRTRILFDRVSADPSFAAAVCEMRRRLEPPETQEPNFKTSPGGVYDLDFLSAYLMIQHGVAEKQGSLRDRLWRCSTAKLLGMEDVRVLDAAAELLRTVEHIVRLVVGRARKSLPVTEHAREVTEKLAMQILGCEFPPGLETTLTQTFQSVRTIFNKILPDAI